MFSNRPRQQTASFVSGVFVIPALQMDEATFSNHFLEDIQHHQSEYEKDAQIRRLKSQLAEADAKAQMLQRALMASRPKGAVPVARPQTAHLPYKNESQNCGFRQSCRAFL